MRCGVGVDTPTPPPFHRVEFFALSFSDLVASDVSNTFLNTAEFAEAATWHFASGDPDVAVNVVFSDGMRDREEHEDGVQDEESMAVSVSLAAVPTPLIGDSITRSADSAVFAVVKLLESGNGLGNCVVQRIQSHERSRGDHRKRSRVGTPGRRSIG